MKSPNTRISTLVLLVVLATSAGWSLATLWPTWTQTQLAVPVLTPIVMSALAVFLVAWTLMVRTNLKNTATRNRLDPIVAVRSAALALSASRVGSIAVGFYAGVLILNALTLDTEASRRCVTISGLTVFASLIVVICALLLERICRLPNDVDKPAAGAEGV
jgi:hypothetical protein